MTSATFVLMNCDLVAVPLQVGGAAVTLYCGARRASQLLGGSASRSGLGSVARRAGAGAASRSGYSDAYISSYVRVTPLVAAKAIRRPATWGGIACPRS
jgi:hypothetical protein